MSKQIQIKTLISAIMENGIDGYFCKESDHIISTM